MQKIPVTQEFFATSIPQKDINQGCFGRKSYTRSS